MAIGIITVTNLLHNVKVPIDFPLAAELLITVRRIETEILRIISIWQHSSK
jgi:hypothetical protein